MFRWFALAVFAGAVVVSGIHRRRARARSGTIPRSREDATLIAGRLLVALPLFGGCLAYVVNPRWMAWSAFEAQDWLRWLGVGLGICVVPSVHWVLSALGSNVSETAVHNGHRALRCAWADGGELVRPRAGARRARHDPDSGRAARRARADHTLWIGLRVVQTAYGRHAAEAPVRLRVDVLKRQYGGGVEHRRREFV
jgi:hypothetical protein